MTVFGPALAFLEELAQHNDKAWFEANRARYEKDVRAPAVAFVNAIAPRLADLSPRFKAIAEGRGSAISRMNRDTRFSADKSPYKDWVGMHFTHESGKEAPGLHLHLSPKDTGVGLGVWALQGPQLAAVRDRIGDARNAWGDVRRALDEGGFTFIGESLKNVPKGFTADHPHADDLKRKTFGAGRPIDPNLPLAAMVEEAEAAYRQGFPLVAFLCEAQGLAAR